MLTVRKPVRVSEEIKALVPSDSALDRSDPQVIKYLEGDPAIHLDSLALKGTPSWVTLRPFSEYERSLLAAESAGNVMALHTWTVRLTLQKIEGVEWSPKYMIWQGKQVLTADSLFEVLGSEDVRHLSNVVWARSVLADVEALPFV